MKFADGNEKLEIHVVDDEKKDMESAADQSVNVPIIDYDHEPRSRNQSSEEMKNSLLQRPQQIFNSETTCLSEKDDSKDNSQSVLVGDGAPSVIVKVTVCVIAFIIMVICLCFLFT
ncbi:hypothetical protein ACH3XW_42775 [Acanthocheilonema viteae]